MARELSGLGPAPVFADMPFSNGRTLMDARALDAWATSTRRALRTLGPAHFGYSDPAAGLQGLATDVGAV